jgi:signal transduction histidine kinase
MIIRNLVSGSMRHVLTTLLLLVLLPVLLVEMAVYLVLLRSAQQAEERATLEVARASALAFEDYIRGILREELAIGLAFETLPPASVQQRDRYLTQITEEYPAMSAFVWLDPQGRIVAAPDPRHIGLDLSDRTYIQQVIAGQAWVVSDLLISRLTGEPAVAVVRSIRGTQGDLQGLVAGYIDPYRLGEALTVAREGTRAIVFVDRQGVVVSRLPTVPLTWEERRWPQAQSLLARGLAGEEVMGTFRSPVDQQQRIAAVVPVQMVGWVAMATRPEREVMAPLLRTLAIEVGILLLIAGIAFGVALLVGRRLIAQIERLERQAQAVGRGELDQRVQVDGPQEIRALATTFNQMSHTLRERERERDAYIHTVSHDLRAPLTVALGHVQLIEDDLQQTRQNGDVREGIRAIHQAMRRMQVMIQDLVDSARQEAGQLRLNVQPTDVRAFVADVLTRTRTALDTSRVHNEIIADIPPVLADHDRLERILMNLLSNALKYSPPTTPVTINATPAEQEVIIAIADQGVGIPPEDQQHLFERFYRAKGTRQTEGIGLGLYITKLLVEAQGGRIWVESETGRGSTFYFTLPVA